MGRGRTGGGVEARDNSIRVSFPYEGVRCRETLSVPPTAENLRGAVGFVADIRRQIAAGTFDYAKTFPHSPRIQHSTALNLRNSGDLWLKSKGNLAAATKNQYKLALAFWYRQEIGPKNSRQALGDRPLEELRATELLALVGSIAWAGPKMQNNSLIALRGALRFARKDLATLFDISDDLTNARLTRPPPDPLSLDEAEAVLVDLRQHYDEQVWNYFEFAFFTGLRPEEEIAVRWSDHDAGRGSVRIERARTFKGGEKATKTYEARDVELTERAKAVLVRQKKHTFLGGGDIFLNPVTRKPWHDERSQREHYWHPALKRLSIRRRRPYQTRHTYATMLLMAGVNPNFVARQLGHKNTRMLYEVYAKWLDGDDRGREVAKLDEKLRGGRNEADATMNNERRTQLQVVADMGEKPIHPDSRSGQETG